MANSYGADFKEGGGDIYTGYEVKIFCSNCTSTDNSGKENVTVSLKSELKNMLVFETLGHNLKLV